MTGTQIEPREAIIEAVMRDRHGVNHIVLLNRYRHLDSDDLYRVALQLEGDNMINIENTPSGSIYYVKR